jgi:hypothetical protein
MKNRLGDLEGRRLGKGTKTQPQKEAIRVEI